MVCYFMFFIFSDKMVRMMSSFSFKIVENVPAGIPCNVTTPEVFCPLMTAQIVCVLLCEVSTFSSFLRGLYVTHAREDV